MFRIGTTDYDACRPTLQMITHFQVMLMSSLIQFRKVVATLAFSTVFISIAPESVAGDLVAEFANPPSETRILKIIHNWPDAAEAQDGLMRKLNDQGFGGVVCNVSFENYLESESKWLAFTRAIDAAKKDGMTLWLYDEKGYPSRASIVQRGRSLSIARASSRSFRPPPGAIAPQRPRYIGWRMFSKLWTRPVNGIWIVRKAVSITCHMLAKT